MWLNSSARSNDAAAPSRRAMCSTNGITPGSTVAVSGKRCFGVVAMPKIARASWGPARPSSDVGSP